MENWRVPFVRRVPDYDIEGENIIISVDGEPFCAFTIADFERGAVLAARAIARHRACTFPRERTGECKSIN